MIIRYYLEDGSAEVGEQAVRSEPNQFSLLFPVFLAVLVLNKCIFALVARLIEKLMIEIAAIPLFRLIAFGVDVQMRNDGLPGGRFLRRGVYPSLTLETLRIGGTVEVFGRSLMVVQCDLAARVC